MEAMDKRRLERELSTLRIMIAIHCRARHAARPRAQAGLCAECLELAEYAALRLGRCPWGEAKPVCAKCEIHCYLPEMRSRVREVMRYAGPRMLFAHPVLGLRHLLAGGIVRQRGGKGRPGRARPDPEAPR
ncbi:MAG TPA: nitrous oxide-stimulated promoter family protein [Rectinemataceae bacterium]|nr:nitrous oxide-stimulated promoter family protein [Rectinemataceae bacterium]